MVNALAVADAVLEAQVRQVTDQVALRELLEAAALINLSKRPAAPRIVIGTAIQAGGATGAGQVNGYPCGGDLPSCCTLAAESGGQPAAQNPTSSSSGLWQFTHDTWAGYGGYSEAKYAPADVQNERARQVFNGGRGASNWYGDGCYGGR